MCDMSVLAAGTLADNKPLVHVWARSLDFNWTRLFKYELQRTLY